MQVGVADFDVVERGFRIVIFNEIMFDTGLTRVREKILPVDGALTDIGHAPAVFDGLAHGALVAAVGTRVFHPVFYVNEGEAAGIFFEISEGILSGDADPAEIHFHADEFGIGLGEKKIVRELAAESFGWLEFEGVIVIAELDAGFCAGFSGFIEKIDSALPTAGLGTLLFVDPGTNDVTVADHFRGLESFGPSIFNDGIVDVAGRRGKGVFIDQLANFFRRVAEIAGEFDLLVAGGGDFGDGAGEVGLHGTANGVEPAELEAQANLHAASRMGTAGMQEARTADTAWVTCRARRSDAVHAAVNAVVLRMVE